MDIQWISNVHLVLESTLLHQAKGTIHDMHTLSTGVCEKELFMDPKPNVLIHVSSIEYISNNFRGK